MGDSEIRRQMIHVAEEFPVRGWSVDVQRRVVRHFTNVVDRYIHALHRRHYRVTRQIFGHWERSGRRNLGGQQSRENRK